MNIIIENGQLLDPSNQLDSLANLYIQKGTIVGINHCPSDFKADQILDAKHCLVTPGFVDLWANLTDETGLVKTLEANCAAANGFTTVFTAPRSSKATDSVTRLEKLLASDHSSIDIIPIGALTENLHGKQMSDLSALFEAGSPVLTNSGYSMSSLSMLRHCYQYAASFSLKIVIMLHEESFQGIIHDGIVSAQTGLAGIPSVAETLALAQHLLLIEETGIEAHFTHISCAASVRMIRVAQQKGLAITADCTMHHLHLTEHDVLNLDPNTYVLPPLRSQEDLYEIRQGLADGTLSAICSSHTPLSSLDKAAPFAETKAGMSTLDSFLSLGLQLVQEHALTLPTLITRLTSGPWSAYKMMESKGLKVGNRADVCVINPSVQWTLNNQTMKSKGKNSPFCGKTLTGKIKFTLKNGVPCYKAEQNTPESELSYS